MKTTMTPLNLDVEINNSEFPVIVKFTQPDIQEFVNWYNRNKEFIDEQLHDKGAVLLRGVNIDSVEGFEKVMDSISSRFMAYVDGNSPRTKLTSKVYTSTEYDPNYSITLHNELSYTAQWPSRIFFCCTIPAATGGETPIADCRKIFKNMNPELVARIEKHGIKYIRNLNGGKGLGPSWQDTFETTDKALVEKFCRESRSEIFWKKDGGLKVVQSSRGIIAHERTGEKVWFNQIDQFHPSHLNKEVYETLMMMYQNEEDLPMYVTFGDGSKVTEDMVKEIRTTVDQHAVKFPWQKGDLLVLDNVLTSHGRMPYSGNRKVLVSMA